MKKYWSVKVYLPTSASTNLVVSVGGLNWLAKWPDFWNGRKRSRKSPTIVRLLQKLETQWYCKDCTFVNKNFIEEIWNFRQTMKCKECLVNSYFADLSQLWSEPRFVIAQQVAQKTMLNIKKKNGKSFRAMESTQSAARPLNFDLILL